MISSFCSQDVPQPSVRPSWREGLRHSRRGQVGTWFWLVGWVGSDAVTFGKLRWFHLGTGQEEEEQTGLLDFVPLHCTNPTNIGVTRGTPSVATNPSLNAR